MLALPSGKTGFPAPQKAYLAPPELTRPAGHNEAKLLVDFTDYPHRMNLIREEKKENIFIWPFFYRLCLIFCLRKGPLKVVYFHNVALASPCWKKLSPYMIML